MPQFEFETVPPQIIWLVITFVALYFIMSWFALPKVGGVIEQRTNRIAGDLDEADRLRRDAERSSEVYQTSLAEARARAHTIHQETRDATSSELETIRRAVEAELEEKLSAAEARIAQTRDKALAEIKDVAIDTAGAIVERLTAQTVDRSVLAAAVESGRRT
ncbi:F0F1 ATP synthase subunit B' [Rhodoligotrophos defluvii]|uniref:F0F1 ATP synthase subunit B family protein n=1 Tax=Rhodoligotrophos defluvii TaxID=2561934 RepID=UPI001484DC12|nr:F0F1 ATP synthase subunit B' [Rhodoligotrophos defluvii]